jgi:hypothetical protein
MSADWCILRMSGAATVPVVTALTEAGFTAWTPVVVEKKRAGPSRKEVERPVPLIPSIAFAHADRLHDLVVMSRSPSLTHRRYNRDTGRMELRGCPHFSVFRDGGHYPLVADRQLEPLRKAEWRGRAKTISHVFRVGDEVARPETNFSGMTGVIQRVKKKVALVLFPGFAHEIEIGMCDLIPVETVA